MSFDVVQECAESRDLSTEISFKSISAVLLRTDHTMKAMMTFWWVSRNDYPFLKKRATTLTTPSKQLLTDLRAKKKYDETSITSFHYSQCFGILHITITEWISNIPPTLTLLPSAWRRYTSKETEDRAHGEPYFMPRFKGWRMRSRCPLCVLQTGVKRFDKCAPVVKRTDREANIIQFAFEGDFKRPRFKVSEGTIGAVQPYETGCFQTRVTESDMEYTESGGSATSLILFPISGPVTPTATVWLSPLVQLTAGHKQQDKSWAATRAARLFESLQPRAS